MRKATASRVVLWMQDAAGDIYSPERRLADANEPAIEDDIWNGENVGVCHSIYAYGSYDNGGSWCCDITGRIAERLAQRSLDGRREPAEAVRAFLEQEGYAYHGSEIWTSESLRDPAPTRPAAQPAAKLKRRAKILTPEQMREQPQFKLPIAGGKLPEQPPAEERASGEVKPRRWGGA
jgi:hypothetical protein